ncbi:TetR-like C-terminal domain-containing protein [Embleya sp. NPDC008237]|uniref:TetR-like C-terminal domain-containing protein n=1 Tax=Embleya sp. NPDC008237 TaxID=3363978 RepID=UPI0036E4D4F1
MRTNDANACPGSSSSSSANRRDPFSSFSRYRTAVASIRSCLVGKSRNTVAMLTWPGGRPPPWRRPRPHPERVLGGEEDALPIRRTVSTHTRAAWFTELAVARVPVPDTGSPLRGDLHSLLTHIAEVYGSAPMYGLARQVIGEACRDPLFRDILRVLRDRRQAVLKTILERGAERGEVAKGVSADLVGNVVIGYFAGLLSADAMFPDAAGIDQLVQLLLQGGGVLADVG